MSFDFNMLNIQNIICAKWKDFCAPNYFDTPIYIAHRTPQEQFPLHNHDFDELIYIYKGFGVNYFKNTLKLILPGHVFFYQANHSHAYPYTQNLHLLNLLINKANFSDVYPYFQNLSEELNKYQQNLFPIPLSYNDFSNIRSFVEKIKTETIHHDEYSYLMISSIFKELVILVIRSLHTQKNNIASAKKTGSGYFKLLVNNHLTNILGYDEFRDILLQNNIHERNFKTYLAKITGLTPNRLIQYNRAIKFANLFIKDPKQNIEDLCYRAGYKDYRSFSRNIFKLYGLSPRDTCTYLRMLNNFVEI